MYNLAKYKIKNSFHIFFMRFFDLLSEKHFYTNFFGGYSIKIKPVDKLVLYFHSLPLKMPFKISKAAKSRML